VSRLQEPRHLPAQPTASAESPGPRRRGREPRTRESRGRSWSSQKRGTLEHKSRTLPCARIQKPTPASHDSGAPRPLARLGKARPLARLGKARPLACPGVGRAVPCRNARAPLCDSELVDPAECATRELKAGDTAALRLDDADRGGLRGRTRRCEAARSAVHSAAALLRAPAELAPADAAESAALHNVFAFLLRRPPGDPRS
jgi:hypothetical protein